MTSGLLSRLNALVLVAMILSGGGSLPVVDALSHLSGQGYSGTPHFEAASASDSHRDFCSLGTSLPFSTHLSAPHPGISVAVVYFPDGALHATAPRSADLGLLPQPRAPPALFT